MTGWLSGEISVEVCQRKKGFFFFVWLVVLAVRPSVRPSVVAGWLAVAYRSDPLSGGIAVLWRPACLLALAGLQQQVE